MSPNPTDGREYKMALARTRQAVAVHKAMQFNAQGSPARCAWPLAPYYQLAVSLQLGLHCSKQIRCSSVLLLRLLPADAATMLTAASLDLPAGGIARW